MDLINGIIDDNYDELFKKMSDSGNINSLQFKPFFDEVISILNKYKKQEETSGE